MPLDAKKPAFAFTKAGYSNTRRMKAATLPNETTQMIPKSQQGDEEFSFAWNGVPLVRIRAGRYEGTCMNSQGPDLVKRYKRWSLRLGFWIHSANVEISGYFNFGRGERPEIKRNSRFFTAWCIANGGLPKLGQHMRPAMFIGKRFVVLVQDAKENPERVKNPDGSLSKEREAKREEEIYSKVTDILGVIHS